jgi:hypothetical protein
MPDFVVVSREHSQRGAGPHTWVDHASSLATVAASIAVCSALFVSCSNLETTEETSPVDRAAQAVVWTEARHVVVEVRADADALPRAVDGSVRPRCRVNHQTAYLNPLTYAC